MEHRNAHQHFDRDDISTERGSVEGVSSSGPEEKELLDALTNLIAQRFEEEF